MRLPLCCTGVHLMCSSLHYVCKSFWCLVACICKTWIQFMDMDEVSWLFCQALTNLVKKDIDSYHKSTETRCHWSHSFCVCVSVCLFACLSVCVGLITSLQGRFPEQFYCSNTDKMCVNTYIIPVCYL